MMDEIGELIIFHRKRSGLSRIKLAAIAGVGKTAIFDIEQGKSTLRLDTLLKILRVLNISVKLESPLMQEYCDLQERRNDA